MPGPLLMGALWDNSCRVWQSGCDKGGSCWMYNRWTMAVSLVLLGVAVRLVSASLYFVAVWCYKPPPDTIISDVIVKTVDNDKNMVKESNVANGTVPETEENIVYTHM